jgi:hypothetical protein
MLLNGSADRSGTITPSKRTRRPALLRSTILVGGCIGVVAAVGMHSQNAYAYNLYDGTLNGQSLEINLDTTVEYSNFYRVNDASARLAGPTNANGNEGDSDFRHGFVSNEFDVTPVFDFKMGNFGAHISGELYLNTSYLEKNQNNQPDTFNPISPATNRDFTSATRNINGQNAVLLDAFAYDGVNFGANNQQTFTLKVGRQTLLWGQSLFFTSNGIAAGQAPVDIIKSESLPNAQTQQVVLPVGQVVATYQPNTWLTLQGYYQFEWEPDNFQGVGAYFSTSDLFDKGGQRLILGPDMFLDRVKDNRPPINNGQFGASVQATLGGYDVGLYGLRFDAKTPEIYTGAQVAAKGPGNVGSYWLVYPRDIQLYGASISTDIGPASVGVEISGRRNMPLDSNIVSSATFPGSANAGALYAVGSTMAAQGSVIYLSPGIPLDPGGVSVDGEFAMNHVLSVDANKSALVPGRDNTAGQFEVVLTPTYYAVLPSIDLQFPIGLTYNIFGRSQINSTENHGTGTVSVGVTATYRTTWTAGLTYNDYLGAPDPALNPLADRGYLSFNIEHTF